MKLLNLVLAYSLLSYSSFISADDNLNRAKELSQRLGNKGIKISLENLADLTKNLEDDTLEKLITLKNNRINTNLYYNSSVFSEGFIEDWGYLIEKGVPLEILKILPEIDFNEPNINDIARSFKLKRYPEYFLNRFTLDNPSYSISIAESDPEFNKGLDWVNNYIKNKLYLSKHITRTDLKDSEDFKDLGSITNVHLAFIIKGYIDFFKKQNTIDENHRLITSKDPQEEKGSIIVYDKYYRLFPINQTIKNDNKRGDENISYDVPDLLYYTKNTGLLHTHPYSIDPYTKKGPERFASPGEIDLSIGNGPGFLNPSLKFNPFFVHVVVTDLGIGKYNYDLYFKDVVKNSKGTFENIGKPIILDLGIFQSNLPIPETYLSYFYSQNNQKNNIKIEK